MNYKFVATTDVHGNIFSRSFNDGSEVPYGAARLCSYLTELRKNNQVCLIDNGDTNQGTPLLTYLNKTDGAMVMSELWQYLGTGFANIGNHDFNYGPSFLKKFIDSLPCPSICCNTYYHGEPIGQPQIFTFGDRKIGLIGVVTDYIDHWEVPANLAGIEVKPVADTVSHWVRKIRPEVDHLIVAYHGGLEANPETGVPTEKLTGENVGYQLCTEIPGIDLLISGHQHRSFITRVGNTVVTQCRDKAAECVEIEFNPAASDSAEVFSARIIDLSQYPVDQQLEKHFQPYWEATNEWLDTPIGEADWDDMYITDFVQAQKEKHPFTTFVNQLQIAKMGTDLAACCMFESMPGWGKSLTYRDVFLNYPFPNTLMVKEISAVALVEYLQQLASYWVLKNGEITIADKFLVPKRELYNYDFVDGIEYTIVVREDGSTVKDILFKGAPLDMHRNYTIALNNYRGTGGGNFYMFPDAPTVAEDTRDMAEIIIEYIKEENRAGRPLTVSLRNNIHLEIGD